MTHIARAPLAAPVCPQHSFVPTPQAEPPMCSTALPDLRLDDNNNLQSNHFDRLSAPSWRRWAPRVFAPKLDRLLQPGKNLEAETRLVIAAVSVARDTAHALQAPIGEAPFVLLSNEAFEAAVSHMAWPADVPVFRQPNGVVLINHERAFEGQGSAQKLTASGLALLNAALQADLYQIVCRQDVGTARLLPVRMHADEGFLTKEQSIEAFADFVFKAATANEACWPQLPEPERSVLQDFKRLLDLPSRRAPAMGAFGVEIISRAFTYTTVIYANLLSEKINPLIERPIRVADHIERLDILFDHPLLPNNALARAIQDASGTPQRQRPLVVQGVAVDERGAMMLSDADILHELVHVAANGNLVQDLPLAAEAMLGARPPLRSTRDLCQHFVRSRDYLLELLPEWITQRLIVEGHPDRGRAQFIGNHFGGKLIENGRLNAYKAGYYTTEAAHLAEGERFIGEVLGKPSPADQAARAARAETLLPRLRTYCEVAVKLITQRGEVQ